MKKVLIDESLGQYRANLHCHTTISDGSKSPEEMKEFYKAHGYSAIAFTDHEAFLTHNDLTDDSFVALNGYELSVSDGWGPYSKCCHICFVALEPDNDIDVCYHRTQYLWGNAAGYRDKIKFDENQPDFVREYTAEGINRLIKRGRDGGFFVTYNHPTWSLEDYSNYMGYEGMNAMEIVNYGCVAAGYDDDNGHAYDDMLRGGKRIFCVATDDNHNGHPDSSPLCDSFGGCTVILAPRLGYRELTSALERGEFYAVSGTSTHRGPEIKSLVWEDGKVTIKTSAARNICLLTGSRGSQIKAANDGETITEATFSIAEHETYFRLTVTDREGYKSYTNAYFTDMLK